MKRRTFRWSIITDGETIAEGERYAHRSARLAAEKALGDICRQAGIYAHRYVGNAWLGTDGRPYTIAIEEVTP